MHQSNSHRQDTGEALQRAVYAAQLTVSPEEFQQHVLH